MDNHLRGQILLLVEWDGWAQSVWVLLGGVGMAWLAARVPWVHGGTQPLCSSPRRGEQVLWTPCRSFWVSRRSPPSAPACKLAGSRSAQRFPWVLSPGVPGGCGHLCTKPLPVTPAVLTQSASPLTSR